MAAVGDEQVIVSICSRMDSLISCVAQASIAFSMSDADALQLPAAFRRGVYCQETQTLLLLGMGSLLGDEGQPAEANRVSPAHQSLACSPSSKGNVLALDCRSNYRKKSTVSN